MIAALQTHAKGRAPAVAVAAIAAIGVALFKAAPPPRTVEGVAEALGKAAGGTVRPDDFLWESRVGFFTDTFWGRRVLFLATSGDGTRDLFRARVKLTRAGRPISIHGVHNLTQSSLGDERDLTGSGHHVAFATATGDGILGVTLLDLDGAASEPTDRLMRAVQALDRQLQTGSFAGLGRTEITFNEPPSELKLEVAQTSLVLSVGPESVPIALDLSTHELQTTRTNPFGAAAQTIAGVRRPAAGVLADAFRSITGLPAGTGLSGISSGSLGLGSNLPLAAPEGLRIAADYPTVGGWPPAPLTSVSSTPFDGEGFWHVSKAFSDAPNTAEAPLVVETVVRPDKNKPGVAVHLIAIDTRRVDLQLVPGLSYPSAATGLHGSGKLPAEIGADDVVAAFVDGPAPAQIPLGYQSENRLFSPMAAGAPTLAEKLDGRLTLGSWPSDAARDAYTTIAQYPDALADNQGAPLAPNGYTSNVGRSALCRTSSGHLVYAFTIAGAASLREGLLLAGCTSGVHMAAEPSGVGFAYFHAGSPNTLATASPKMSASWAEPWQQSIGVLIRRAKLPRAWSSKKVEWTVDAGTQPEPTWLPAVYTTEVEELGAKVKVYAFLPDRFSFRLAAGSDETTTQRSDKPGPTEAERTSAAAAFGLSVARRTVRRGLIVNGNQVSRVGNPPGVWLTLQGTRLNVLGPGQAPAAGIDGAELTLVADERTLLPAAREVGTQRPRSALCTLPDGLVLVAHTSFDTEEAVTQVLLDLGCDRVASLDRGAHDGVFVHRAGTDSPPAATYEASALYVLPGPAVGTAQSF
ncbi:MAG: hypothetical protein IPK82_06275 [Polyangiaceae bacterium]|nr:hypothetical protein [Polyangiaceae bacterium]